LIEVRQLRYFVAVAEELHFGRAAERLRISKPTLSQQMRVLERRLGVSVLERGHQLRLTAVGEVLLREARLVLEQHARLHVAVEAAAHRPEALEIRLVNGVEFALRERLAAFSASGGPSVTFVATSAIDAEQAVIAGRADAALIWAGHVDGESLHRDEVGTAEVWLAMPPDHALSRYEAVPVDVLRDERVVLFPRASAPRVYDAFTRHLCPDGKVSPHVITPQVPVVRMGDILREVKNQKAVAPFVHAAALALLPEGVALRPLDPPMVLGIQLVSRDRNSGPLQALSSFLQASAVAAPS
jgi:DNA-binding transcriptional LysR family regulator